MRKKQLVSRLVLEANQVDDLSQENLKTHTMSGPVSSVPVVFQLDADGQTTLPDGTPVVEPVSVDTKSAQLSKAPRTEQLSSRVSRLFNPGVLDVVKCTACAAKLHLGTTPLKVHPVLEVIMCKKCAKFYSRQKFLQDVTGKDENCRWCADGGDLICCDSCSNAFCKRCIKRNLGRTVLHEIESLGDGDIWKCFVCDSSSLQFLRTQCSEIMHDMNEFQKVQKRRIESRQEASKARSVLSSKPCDTNPSEAISVYTISTPALNATTLTPPAVSKNPSQGGLLTALSNLFSPQPQSTLSQSSDQSASMLNSFLQLFGNTLPASPNFQPTDQTVPAFPLLLAPATTLATPPSGFPLGRPTTLTQTSSTNESNQPIYQQSPATFAEPKPIASTFDISVVLNQIASVNENNIRAALRATRRCIDTFSADISRLENKMATSSKPSDVTNVVRSFQSIYRFHLIARLSNLATRMREEAPFAPRANAVRKVDSWSGQQPPVTQLQSSHPVTIDLTTDNSPAVPTKLSRDTSTKPVVASFTTIDSYLQPYPSIVSQTSFHVAGDKENQYFPQTTVLKTGSTTLSNALNTDSAADSQPPSKKQRLDGVVSDESTKETGCGLNEDISDHSPVDRFHSPLDQNTPVPNTSDPITADAGCVSTLPETTPSDAGTPTDKRYSGAAISPPVSCTTSIDNVDDVEWHLDTLMSAKSAVPNTDVADTISEHSEGSHDSAREASLDSCDDEQFLKQLPIHESAVFLEDIGPRLGDTSVIHLDNASKSVSDHDAGKHSGSSDSDADLSSKVSALERACSKISTSGVPPRSDCKSKTEITHLKRSRQQSKHRLLHDLDESEWSIEEDLPDDAVIDDTPVVVNLELSETDADELHILSPAVTKEPFRSAPLTEAESEYYADLNYREQLLRSSSGDSADESIANRSGKVKTFGAPVSPKANGSPGISENSCAEKYAGSLRNLMRPLPALDRDSVTSKHTESDQANNATQSAKSLTTSASSANQLKTNKTDLHYSISTDESDVATEESDISYLDRNEKTHSSRMKHSREASTDHKAKKKSLLSDDSSDGPMDNSLVHRKALKKLVELNTTDSSDSESAGELKGEVRRVKRPVKARRRLRSHHKRPSEDDADLGEEENEQLSERSALLRDADSDSSDIDRKGRRKIRKIKSQSSLSQTTKTAEAEERDRRRRLVQRQKEYNDCVLQVGVGLDVVTKSLILEKSPDKPEPLVQLHSEILKHLKPHQVEAVRFLWDCVIESVELHKSSSNERSCGAILAHCMGLGKTLSIIAFIHTLFTHSDLLHITRCLVLCPVNTLLNWKHEWETWLPEDATIDVFELASKNDFRLRVEVLKHWFRQGGVLLLGYDMFRNFINARGKKARNKITKDAVMEALLDPGPHLVVCDEGHVLKNVKSGLSKAISQIRTLKRVVLTGTPLQNNLNEYHAMVNFVKPNLLGTAREFYNRFANPIRNGQHSNSTARDVSVMKKRAHVLYKTLDGCVQRKDYNALTKYLPPRYEYVVMCRLSTIQCDLYRTYLQIRNERSLLKSKTKVDDVLESECRSSIFADQQTLFRIWTHPFLLRSHEIREARRVLLIDDDEDEEEVDWTDEVEESDTTQESGDGSESEAVSSADVEVPSKQSNDASTAPKHKRRTRSQRNRPVEDDDVVCLDSDNSQPHVATTNNGADNNRTGATDPWWYKLYKNDFDWTPDVGGKLDVLLRILKKCMDIGDKVLIFTQSLLSLDLLERFLGELHRQWLVNRGEISDNIPEGESGPRPDLSAYFSDVGENTWVRGHDYERMDGSMNAVVRKTLQHRFNRSNNSRLRVFLISTRAGGLGINLVAANRLILFDASWNPSNDIQSIFRSYRFGQTKPVYIYRLIAQGTMEEKIYDRQVTKQSLALRVVDERQIGRHFTNADLHALYIFDPDIWDPTLADKRPTPKLPKDRLLADMLSEFSHLITNYHEHDSLLEHREDEGLTEAERQEAWREYEEEKTWGMPLHQHQRLMQHQEMVMQTQNQLHAWRALQEQQQQLFLQQQQQWMSSRQYPPVVARPPLLSNPVTNVARNPNPVTYKPPVSASPAEPTTGRLPTTLPMSFRLPGSNFPYPLLYEKYRTHLLKTRPSLANDPVQLEKIVLAQMMDVMTREVRTTGPLSVVNTTGSSITQPKTSF